MNETLNHRGSKMKRKSNSLYYMWVLYAGLTSGTYGLAGELSLIDGIATSEFPAVGVLLQFTSSTNGYGQHFCTGTLIAKDLVVTAAHCMNPLGYEPGTDIEKYKIEFWTKPDVSFLKTSYEQAKDKVDCAAYRQGGGKEFCSVVTCFQYLRSNWRSGGPFDTAVLKLKESAEGIPFPQLMLAKGSIQEGDIGVPVGYGYSTYDIDEDGKRILNYQKRTGRLAYLQEEYSMVSWGSTEGVGRYVLTFTPDKLLPQTSKMTIQQGDSGGPVFFQGNLIGIASYGPSGAGAYITNHSSYAPIIPSELRPVMKKVQCACTQ